MVKSSVLLMSVFALGLTLGSGVEAGKNDQEGPMDKFVIRTLASKRPASSTQDSRLPSAQSSSKGKEVCFSFARKQEQAAAQRTYVAASSDNSEDDEELTPFQRAYLLKTDSAS